MSASQTDLDGAIARLDKALSSIEQRVRELKATPPGAVAGDDLFADDRAERELVLEAAAAEASVALDRAAAEIRAVLGES